MIHGHGGGVFALARELGCAPEDIVDMSSNINPLGPPPGLLEHLAAHLGRIARLPDADSDGACRDLAALLDLDPARILAGAGTTQFIYDACRALESRRALIVGPAYADYADACRQAGIEPAFLLTQPPDFHPDFAALDARLPGHDLLFLCAPNNPTGGMPPLADLAALARRHPGTRFLLDASYLPFAEPGLAGSLSALDGDNILALWSGSKIFAMPGLRTGFLVGHPELLARFRALARPWSLGTLGQEAMRFLAAERQAAQDFVHATHVFIRREGALLRERLRGDYALSPSQTSFCLIHLPPGLDAGAVRAALMKQKILIRDCANFHGLSGRFIRVALKDPAANARLAELLNRLSPSP